jgi:NAD(P)-dependent dehydrogenase (short-subunit alcohol dehydrogenase family)
MPIESTLNAFSLKGKNAIVTGGSKGIGLGIAEAFAEQGASVAIFARDAKAGEEAAAGLSSKYGVRSEFYDAVMSGTASCRAAVGRAIADFGEINILVNNAGHGPNGDLLDMDEEISEYFKCIDVDLNGVVRMTYLVGRHMRERGRGGKIINISSNAGEMASRAVFMASYCTAKAGVNQFTRAMALELAGHHINVNAIAPGYTYSNLLSGLPEATIEGIARSIPTGRLGTAIEIGALAVYLASAASDQVTGAIVTIDGGHSLGIY